MSEVAWKIVFTSRGQRLIVECALVTYIYEIKSLVDSRIVSQITYDSRLDDAQAVMGSDITKVSRYYRDRIARTDDMAERDLKGILQSLFFEGKRSDGQVRTRELEKRMRRIVETEMVLNVLREARNVYAHEIGSEKSRAWSEMVVSSTKYFFETAVVPEARKDEVDSFVSGLNVVPVEVDTQLSRAQPVTGVPSESYLEGITQELAEIKRLIDLGAGVATSSQDDLPTINEVELETLLLEIKAKINEEMRGPYWPGPGANLCQKTIIGEILAYKPRDITEALRLPDVAWRVEKNRSLFRQQVDKYGDEINALLQRTDWERNDDSVF